MARNQNIIEKPVSKYLTWKTIRNQETEKVEGGSFLYWDKEQEKNIEIELPFKFAVLEENRVTFKGYNEKRKEGVYANEVQFPEQEVTIKSKSGTLLSFKKKDYKANKDAIAGFGAKWTQVVYIAVPNKEAEEGFEIWSLLFNGASLTGGVDRDSKDPDEKADGWINFLSINKGSINSHFFEVNDFKIKKRGMTKFAIPVFKVAEKISTEEGKILDNLYAKLKEYFTYYDKAPAPVAQEEAVEVEDDNDANF